MMTAMRIKGQARRVVPWPGRGAGILQMTVLTAGHPSQQTAYDIMIPAQPCFHYQYPLAREEAVHTQGTAQLQT